MSPSSQDFSALTPDTVLDIVEDTLGQPSGHLCRPLNSYINRVYEVHPDDGAPLIVKFYRPGRWTWDALQDELDFVTELAAADIPVVAPLTDDKGETLHSFEGIAFAVYPKRGGRVCDEPGEEEWRQLGRLLGRVHSIGAEHSPRDRIILDPDHTEYQLDEILDTGSLPPHLEAAYEDQVLGFLEDIDPLFEALDLIRIHGDCHHQNILFRPGEGFHIIDFDDMAVGPPIQDLWMLLPGRLTDARRELEQMLEGYEVFRPFDRFSLRLIEPLRAMRYVHFTAWCARQAADSGFRRLSPDWGTESYWRRQIEELTRQRQEIQDALHDGGDFNR